MAGRGAQPCPDDETLLAFSEGELEGPALDEVVAHLDACDECLSVVGGGSVRRRELPALPALPALPPIAGRFGPGMRVANRYTIARFLARGGMGEVYEAADDLLGLRVALKTVLSTSASDPRAVELLRREVRMARSITHPGVCRVFDLGEHPVGGDSDEKLLFLSMEFLEGMTLGQRIRRLGPLPVPLLLNVARQLASALAAAHVQGIVHRDFKSDNVMWLQADEGAPPRVVIMDFGLARLQAAGLTSTAGLVVGSAAYMAPEQVQGGQVAAAADVYAYGVVLFELATGRLPFVASTLMGTALMRLHEPPPQPRTIVPELHPALEDVILRCLARQPADRPANLDEVLVALADVDADPAATQAMRTQRVKRPVRRMGLAIGALGLGALMAGMLYTAGGGEPRQAGVQRPAAATVRVQAPAPLVAPAPVAVDRAPSERIVVPDAGAPARPVRPRRLAKQGGAPISKPARAQAGASARPVELHHGWLRRPLPMTGLAASLLALLVQAPSANAADVSAEARFDQAKALYDQGRYDDAAETVPATAREHRQTGAAVLDRSESAFGRPMRRRPDRLRALRGRRGGAEANGSGGERGVGDQARDHGSATGARADRGDAHLRQPQSVGAGPAGSVPAAGRRRTRGGAAGPAADLGGRP